MPTRNHPTSGPSRLRRTRAVLAEALEPRRLFDGLTGQYFNRIDHTELAVTRLDPSLDFNWGGMPTDGVNANMFSVRWTGQVQAATTELYTFTTTADDGVRLWVDGRLLVDNWVNQGATERSATVALEAGKRYDIRIDYYEFDLGARLRLQWNTPTIARQVVPTANLFAAPSGLSATYFDGVDFNQPAIEQTDSIVDFAWPDGTPAAGVVADGFSARWSGYVVPEYTQTYTFRVVSPAGSARSAARLRIDGQLIVDDASVQDGGRIKLEAGKQYALTLDYADPSGAAGVSLQWQSPSQPLQVIPTSRLFAGVATSIPGRQVAYSNPILDFDAPDPTILRADGAYWMLHTMGGPDVGWPLWKSLDGVNWTFQKHLLTTANKRPFMSGNFWAPELHKVGNNFILTGTSTDSRTGQLVIVMAVSDTVDGNYTLRTDPIVSNPVAVLDSHIFTDDDGRNYLLWKRDSDNHTGTFGSIRIRELDASGLFFASGSTERVILDNLTGGWERNLAEAPWLVRRDDAYYLFYSGGFIDTTYSIGVARSTSLETMFTRNPANPILTNNSTYGGPGHGGFALDADGTLWHLYHSRKQADPNFGRVQMLDPVVWTASGWPSFAGNSPSTTAQLGPKVEAVTGAGVITLTGDATAGFADRFRLVRSGVDSGMLDLYVNNVLTRSIPFAEAQRIAIEAGEGDDTLVLDFTNGDVIPGAGLTFTGGGGTGDDVQIVAPDGGVDAFRHLGGGAIAFGSGYFAGTGVEKYRITGGTHRVIANLSNADLEVRSGKLTFEFNQSLVALSIFPNALVALAATNRALVTKALMIYAGGTLDLTNGALVVDYAATAASPLATVEAALRRGRGTGGWNYTSGIISSTAAANLAAGATLGSGESSSIFTNPFTPFSGAVVDRTAVLVRYTIDGDATLNRKTDFDDLLALARRYGQSGQSFTGGNFDYSEDGTVTFDDLLILARRYGQSITAVAATAATLEPTARTRRTSTASDIVG